MRRFWEDKWVEILPEERQFIADSLTAVLDKASAVDGPRLTLVNENTVLARLGELEVQILASQYGETIVLTNYGDDYGDVLQVSITPSDERKEKDIRKLIGQFFRIAKQQKTQQEKEAADSARQNAESLETTARSEILQRLRHTLDNAR